MVDFPSLAAGCCGWLPGICKAGRHVDCKPSTSHAAALLQMQQSPYMRPDAASPAA
jgi:hypothetical protein